MSRTQAYIKRLHVYALSAHSPEHLFWLIRRIVPEARVRGYSAAIWKDLQTHADMGKKDASGAAERKISGSRAPECSCGSQAQTDIICLYARQRGKTR